MNSGVSDVSVLVTGGLGYLGSWMLIALLRQGYRVRASLRDLAQEKQLRATLAPFTTSLHRLSFHRASLLRDEGWDSAMQQCQFVVHTAAPVRRGDYRPQDIIAPTRQATLRILRAAQRAGVRRLVLTSSAQAALPPPQGAAISDETQWTGLDDTGTSDTVRAKTLAEQDAWTFVRTHGGPELVTVLPAFIQGPVVSADYSASIGLAARILRGKMPLLPRLGFCLVDVRDLVDLHLRAMTHRDAANQRFIAAGEFLWMQDIAAAYRDAFPERAATISLRSAPDALVRLLALFSGELRQAATSLGQRREFSSAKAERMLDWRPRPARESLIEGALSLLHKGLA